MGVLVKSFKQGLGWPNPGWAPPPGASRGITDILVTNDTALTVSAFHTGVRLIAEDIAGLPLNIFRKDGPRRIEAPSHPSYTALHASPNPEMTAMVWRETMIGHYLTWGNAYSEKEFNALNQVVRLWPLRPDRMKVERDDAGGRVYKYRLRSGEQVILPQRNVFHVPGFGFDGLVGYSRLTMARRALENAIAIEEYGLHTFASGGQRSVVIKHAQQLSTEAKQNIVASWEKNHSGLENAQRTGILDEGMDLEEVGFPPEDAQFIESKKHSVEEIARWLRLAPHKLSDFSRATFSNIEESNLDHVTSTLMPIGNRFEQQYDKDVLGGGAFYTKHNFAALLRGNSKDRAEFYKAMREIGVYTDDEIRAFEDMNPLTDEDRQRVLWPLNSVPAAAYDEQGMTMQNRVDAAGVLVRAGYDPMAALRVLNLPPIEHTGLVPVTVTLDPLTAPQNGQGATVP
jgi:HK97 family phage portal protein